MFKRKHLNRTLVVSVILVATLFLSIQSAFAVGSSGPVLYGTGPTPTPGSPRELCEDHGGEWIGNGTYKESCVYSAPYRHGKSGASTTGAHWRIDSVYKSTTLYFEGEKNGYAIFPFLGCPLQCSIVPTLPRGAANDLPEEALATMYVRLVNLGGAPGTSSYWVCFENRGLKDPAIFRYIGGEWMRLTFARSSNPFCTFVSSEGAYYFGNG